MFGAVTSAGMRTFLTFITALVLIVVGSGRPGRAAEDLYAKVGEIPIGGASAWDYLTVDSAGKRLYVSHGTEVVVIDLTNNTIVGRISDTPGVHGVAVVSDIGRLFTTNGRENKVSVVDAKTLQTLSKVDTGANPDAIVYEPTRKEIYALNHTGHSVTAFEAATGKVTATIPLAGTAESGQADPGLSRVFVNIEDKDSVDVIDTTKHQVVANWPVAPASSPTGMAIDSTAHRLFVGGGKALVMIDETTGKVVANVPICSGTDATSYDPATKLVFASCRDGHVTIARVDGPDKLSVVQTLDTMPRSRTMTLDPSTHKIYLAAVKSQPDSFHILIFGMRM